MKARQNIAVLKKTDNGFTLVELIVAIIILGILSGVSYSIIVLNAQTFRLVSDHTSAQWDLRQTMSRLKRDLQMLEPAKIISAGKLSNKSIAFTTAKGHLLQFRKNGGRFERKWDTEGWQLLLSDMQKDPFIYLDKNLNVTSDKKKIRYIDIQLTSRQNNKTLELKEKVYVRN